MELSLDEVDAGHLLGHGVFHLNAGIALDEEVLAGFGRDQEFHGPGVDVARGARQLGRIGEDPLAQRLVEPRRRRHLDDFLVAELHRAIALVEVDHVAVRVGEDLYLDVSRPPDESLQEHRAVAEGRLRLALAAGERFGHFLGISYDAHPATASARRRLEHDRVAELACQLRRFFRRRQRLDAPGHDGDAERAREAARPYLVAEEAEHGGGRTDEDQAFGCARGGELGVLCQESITRVNGITAARLGGPEQHAGVEVRSDRVTAAAPVRHDLSRLGGVAGMQRERVDRSVHADGLHTERRRRLGDAYGDLAPVAYQNAFQQGHSSVDRH